MDDPKIIIIADNREANSQLTNILKKRCELQLKQLEVADYLISERVAIERKTIPDFLQSIIDGRLFEQLSNLQNNYDKPLLLIEGDEDIYKERKMHPNAIRGALASITIDMAIPILWTKNQLESADLICAIAKREQVQAGGSSGVRAKRRLLSENQEQQYLIEGLPKVSGVLAKRLLKQFGTPEKIFTASEEELMQVEGVGDKMAKRIRTLLGRKYEKSILED